MEIEQTFIHRYPGVKPFSENERHLFYGRSTDTNKLSQLIRLEKMVLLYSKSGLGKSSLLNAGVLPLLEEEEQYTTIKIRFGARFEGSLSPVATSILKLPETSTNAVLDKLGAGNDTLWLRMKALQYNSSNIPKTYILVFDQFEELFTYDKDDIKQFKRQLADLLFSKVPGYISQSITNRLKEDPAFLTNEALEFLYLQPSVKVVLSIRSDRLSLLNSLTDYLPDILKNYYELKPLDRNAAIDAIVKPAADEKGLYLSARFAYTKACIDQVLNYLTENDQKTIETFQLQTVCQFAENLAIENKLPYYENEKSLVVELELLGDLQNIFRTHYDKLISNIVPDEKQLAARLLIENKLIIDGNRVSLPDVVVLKEKDIDKDLIIYLHDTHHLLRSEPNTTGGISYELSHDTLVAPILKAKKEREEKEEIARLENERMEESQREREKAAAEKGEREKEQKRQRKIIAIVSVAALLSICLAIFGFVMWQKAAKQTYLVKSEQNKSDSLLQVARNSLQKFSTEERMRKKAEVQSLVQKAKSYFSLDVPDLAVDALNKAAAIDPTNTEVISLQKSIKK